MTTLGQGSTTPILDLEAPLPPARDDRLTRKEIVGVVVLALAGIVVPVITSLPLPPRPLPVEQMLLAQVNDELLFFFLLTLFGLPIIWITVVAIHELGHVVAGLGMGFRFQSLGIGPLAVEYKHGRWKTRTHRKLLGGHTDMVLDRIWRVRRRLILFSLGGPAADILFSGIAFAAAANIRHPALFLVTLYFGLCSGISAFLSFVPIRSGSSWEHVTDADFLWALFMSKESTTQLIAQHAVSMLRNRGLDELRWNPRWIRMGYPKAYWDEWLAYRSIKVPSAIAVCLEQWLADSGCQRAEERDGLILEASFFSAWHRDDAVKSDTWFRRVTDLENIGRYRMRRTEIALDCARRQFVEALDGWEGGLQLLQSLSEPWVRPIEHEWIEWRAEIEKRRADCTPLE
jgi:hypothetical protein